MTTTLSMESLQLPQDLYWDVKMEPDSPSNEFIPFINTEDSWLFEDNFAKDIITEPKKIELDIISNASSPSSAYTDGELLYEFEYDPKSEQSFNDKLNINQLDFTENLIPPQSCPSQAIKVQNSLEIFMELEKIYNVTELTQLTPPQTPPQEVNEVKEIFDLITAQQNVATTNCSAPIFVPLVNNQNIENDVCDIIPALSPSNSDGYSSDIGNSPLPSASDIARDLQIVDEILRTRAKELPDWTDNEDDNENDIGVDASGNNDNTIVGDGIDYDYDDGESLHSSLSETSSTSPLSSSLSSTSSSLPLSPTSSTNDDEWIPSAECSSDLIGKIKNNEKSQKRRTRPYGRPVEDKKIRKKEQNKNAATRYRQKKKQEMEEILEVERDLITRNEDLQKQVTDVEREIKYLKQLIREFHKSKKSK